MSISRRLRRAIAQGKRPEDITIKPNSRGRAPIYAPRDYTANLLLAPKYNDNGKAYKD